MARTVEEIQTQIKSEIASDSILSTKATSTSKVAEWNLWTRVIARCIYFFEVILDAGKAFIQSLVSKLKPGTPDWLVEQAKLFQFGDVLEVIDGVVTYADTTSDAALAKRIVKRASWSFESLRFKLKVATEDNNGLPIPITGLAKTAFDAYIDRIKFAGMDFDVESKYTDKLNLAVTVYHNPLIDPATLTTPINDAVKAYLKGISFNGVYLTDKMYDAIQSIPNVTTTAITTHNVSYNNGPADTDYSLPENVTLGWRTKAGFIKLASDITINYLPDTDLLS